MPPAYTFESALSPALVGDRRVSAARQEKNRRLLNIAVAAVGLVASAPLMALIAVAVRLTSRGPVIYRQTRVGVDRRRHIGGNHRRHVDHGGRPFTMYKFRTMTTHVGATQTQVWASRNDARVTLIGRLLRKYRLDELPQLYNVLRGDMNVVGPRPEQPTIFKTLRDSIPNYQARQLVRPGITGWAQINQHYDTSIDDVRRKVAYDLEYIGRQSLGQDLKIMLLTAPVMVFKKGAW